MRRWIMHVDMDAFYASVEQRDHPEWRGKPVIVGGVSARGVVATASYEARRYGVHSALAGKIARERCPDGIFVAPRIAVYRAISHRIREILLRYAPAIEPLSLDEAFLDVSGLGAHFATLQDLGRAVQRDIYAATELTASVGIAPNKFLAKLASDLHKPNGLVVIPYGREKEILAPLPVRKLWGVGGKTEAILVRAGLRTVGDVAAADPLQLERLVGRHGRTLKELAQGKDDRPVEGNRQRKSLGEEETYPEDLHDDAVILRYLQRYCDLVAAGLRREGLRARTVTLKLRTGSYKTITRSVTVTEPMDLQQELYFRVHELYNRIKRKEGVRLLGVTASNLIPAGEEMSLFPGERERQRQVARTLDSLRAKFGEQAVRPGYWWEDEKEEEERHDQ